MPDVWTLPAPNVRSMIVPSPGYILVEGDLSGADAQVVAWDSGAARLKARLRAGVDLHSDNAARIYGPGRNYRHEVHVNGMTLRDNAKRAVHAGNYDTTPRTLGSAISISTSDAEKFLHWWKHEENPEIGEWHRRIRFTLNSRKMPVIHNAFGFRRLYTDRPDRLLGQALAWIAQSTVALVINHALVRIDQDLCEGSNWGVQLLGTFAQDNHEGLQVHDSILLQVPVDVWPDVAPLILERMAVTVPYPDPLVIPSELKWSGEDWSKMEKWNE